MDLTNASAIVTGGAGAFGSATVRRLAQKGAKVVIADVSDEQSKALAREVGAGSLYVPTDCMDEDAIAKAVKVVSGCCAPPLSPTSARTGPAAAGPPGCWTPTGFDTPWQSSHT
jgi:NAD(P)-dependent dehydrogenase (short-subunit alcohol dehydrogenase family)